MKKIAILLLFSTLIVSCNEETTYYLQINLENDVESSFEVTLYPQEEYLNETLYKFSDFGGGYNQTKFVIESGSDNALFSTKNLDIKPYELASSVFDSILVKLIAEPEIIIKFSIDTVINYHDNLFDSNSNWNYMKVEGDEPDMFNKNPTVTDNYTFVISNVQKK